MSTINGTSGSDNLVGTSTADKISGGAGDDTLSGDSGSDKLAGGSGNDTLNGGSGSDELEGGSGNDFLFGGSGNDELEGGSGNDALIGGDGADELEGGSGSDLFVYLSASDSDTSSWDRILDFMQGRDTIDLSALLDSVNLAWGGKTALANGAWYSNSGSSTFVFADITGNGIADLKIELKDSRGLALTADDFLGVGGSAPVASNSAAQGNEDTVFGGLLGATDADGDPLEFLIVDGPLHGTVVVDEFGNFTYTPDANFNGADQFTFKVNDGSSDSNVATVMLTVDPVNDVPVAAGDSALTNEDSALLISALSNDSDVDAGAVLSVQSFDTSGTKGSVVLNADGTFSYDPNGQFESLAQDAFAFDSFSYTVQDEFGATDTAIVTVKVTGVNDAPLAQNDGALTDENTAINISKADLIANDTDVDAGDMLSLLSVDATGTKGSVTLNGNGGVHYDPSGQFDSLAQGAVAFDTFSYTVQDKHGATATASVTVTVTGVNDAPLAVADVVNALYDHNGFDSVRDAFGNVLLNDTDPEGDSLILTEVEGSPDNLATFFEGDFGFVNFSGDGSGNWSYFINQNGVNALAANGQFTEVFDYTVAEDNAVGAFATSTLSIHITDDDFLV
ncbi:MAG: Ig-like domain-containing protein [Burkholderiales bacterium]